MQSDIARSRSLLKYLQVSANFILFIYFLAACFISHTSHLPQNTSAYFAIWSDYLQSGLVPSSDNIPWGCDGKAPYFTAATDCISLQSQFPCLTPSPVVIHSLSLFQICRPSWINQYSKNFNIWIAKLLTEGIISEQRLFFHCQCITQLVCFLL